jgi:glycine/D-amino acid oxidase-like deaminating enzyme
LNHLSALVVNQGGRLYENTRVTGIEEKDGCRVTTEKGVVLARTVVVAAHTPVSSRFRLYTELPIHRTYAIAVEMSFGTDALFWDAQAPHHYFRPQRARGVDHLIVGGEAHRIDELVDESDRFARLE